MVPNRIRRLLLQEPARQGGTEAVLYLDIHRTDIAQPRHALPRALLSLQASRVATLVDYGGNDAPARADAALAVVTFFAAVAAAVSAVHVAVVATFVLTSVLFSLPPQNALHPAPKPSAVEYYRNQHLHVLFVCLTPVFGIRQIHRSAGVFEGA